MSQSIGLGKCFAFIINSANSRLENQGYDAQVNRLKHALIFSLEQLQDTSKLTQVIAELKLNNIDAEFWVKESEKTTDVRSFFYDVITGVAMESIKKTGQNSESEQLENAILLVLQQTERNAYANIVDKITKLPCFK